MASAIPRRRRSGKGGWWCFNGQCRGILRRGIRSIAWDAIVTDDTPMSALSRSNRSRMPASSRICSSGVDSRVVIELSRSVTRSRKDQACAWRISARGRASRSRVRRNEARRRRVRGLWKPARRRMPAGELGRIAVFGPSLGGQRVFSVSDSTRPWSHYTRSLRENLPSPEKTSPAERSSNLSAPLTSCAFRAGRPPAKTRARAYSRRN
jgi:hypothetical protein